LRHDRRRHVTLRCDTTHLTRASTTLRLYETLRQRFAKPAPATLARAARQRPEEWRRRRHAARLPSRNIGRVRGAVKTKVSRSGNALAAPSPHEVIFLLTREHP